MEAEQVENLINQFNNISILVIGDLMLDEYIWGDVSRISPEAPVPVLRASQRIHKTLGGAGNVIKNLKSLGASVIASGVVGDDQAGREILKKLGDLGVSTKSIYISSRKCSTKKTRLMSSSMNQQVFRLDQESVKPIERDIEDTILESINERIESIDVVLISDYLKGTITTRIAQNVIAKAGEKNKLVIIDPKGSFRNREKYSGATALTPNVREAVELSGLEEPIDYDISAVGRKLLRDLDLECLVITRGSEGMSVFTNEGETYIPAKTQQVFDVTGAGDTATSVFTLSLASGASFEDAVRMGNIAGALAVSRVGTVSVTGGELYQSYIGKNDQNKIVSRKDISKVVEENKVQGKDVVFTNGCFDLLHVGHVSYLEKASSLGDLLIVGLNSDDSVRRIKGDGRPIISHHQRARILAALEFVDYVVIFEEDTPQNLIKQVKPQILVKGKDYKLDEVVGREIVENNGGRLELIDLVDGISTSDLIDQIKQS